jgi:hemolysin III
MGPITADQFLREPVSSVTHLSWAIVALFMTAIFYRVTPHDPKRRWSLLCFGISMCLLYTASGLYHGVNCRRRETLRIFQLIDHSMIYVLIAGTFTPIVIILLREPLRTRLFCLIWGLALLGILCKWILATPPYPVTVALYVGMGWVGIIPLRSLIRAIGWKGMAWGLLGGMLYTVGGICDACQWPMLIPHVFGSHEVMHLFDMAATAVHVYFILRFVLPYHARFAHLPPQEPHYQAA